MTKILDTNNILDAITESQMPQAAKHIREVEKAVTKAAKALAKWLSVKADEADYQPGFAGLCVNFRPAHEGQPCPPVIDEGDESGEWDDSDDEQEG